MSGAHQNGAQHPAGNSNRVIASQSRVRQAMGYFTYSCKREFRAWLTRVRRGMTVIVCVMCQVLNPPKQFFASIRNGEMKRVANTFHHKQIWNILFK